jgi:hypothetical protein
MGGGPMIRNLLFVLFCGVLILMLVYTFLDGYW